MKKIIIFLALVALSFSIRAQFPGTDSLRNYNNRFITNNAQAAFTNLRLHNLLAGMIDWEDSARLGAGGTLGVDTIYAVNDSTIRYRKSGVFRTFIIRGTAWAGKIYEVPFSNGFGRFLRDSNFVYSNATPDAGSLTVGPLSVISGGLSKVNITSDNMNALALTAFGTGLNTIIARRGNGTVASPTNVLNGNDLWNFSGRGYTGTQWSGTRAAFYSRANQNWTDSTNGTFIAFQTTHNDSIAPLERFIIDHDGHIFLPAYAYLPRVTDTAVFKPMSYNSSTGKAEPFGYWPGSGSADSSVFATKYGVDSAKTNLRIQIAGKQPSGNYITATIGDVTASGPGSVAATISNNVVTDAKIRQSAGLAVIGRSVNSTGNVADITAVSDGATLRLNGTSIGFGALNLASANAVTGILPYNNLDTPGLKNIYLPLFLSGNKTINQAANNIYFTGGGKLKADSISLKKTLHPYLAADSALANGHSIMFGSAATVPDSAFATIVARSHGLSLSNIAVSGSIIYNAIKLQMQWINPGHNSYEMVMAAVNDVRTTNILLSANRPTINHIINSVKSMWMNHMSKIVVATGSSGVTRSGSWTTSWNAANESGKSTNGAYTTTAGNYIEYAFTDSTVGFQLMGLNSVGSTTITVAIDGSTVETFSANQQHDNSGGSYAPMCKFYTGLSVASHTIRVTNTSGGFMVMDYFTNLRDAATAPPICLFHEPHLNISRSPSDFGSDAAIDTINAKYDSLRNSFPVAYRTRTLVARTNTRYDATTADVSGDFIHPSNQGHRKVALTEHDAFSAIGADSGTVQYGDDGFLYVDARKIPYTTTLGLGDVINNNSVLTAPAYITGNSINFNFFKVSNTTAYAHGALGVQGASGGIYILDRSADTTKGFLYYSSGTHTFLYDLYNNRTAYAVDTSLRIAFYNNTVTSSFGNPSATIHIGGNTNGVAGHTPFKIGKSAWIATPEAYAFEPDSLYIGWTNGGGTRDTIATRGWTRANLTSGIASINSQTGPAYTISTGLGLASSLGTNSITVSVDNNSTDISHVVDKQFTDANNSSTTETDLYSKSIAANTLINNGASIHFDVTGQLNDATATVDIQFYFGGTSFGNTGALTLSATGAWSARGYVIRATSTTARAFVTFTTQSASTASYAFETDLTGLDFTTGNILKVTGQAGGATGGSNDITAKTWKLIFQP